MTAIAPEQDTFWSEAATWLETAVPDRWKTHRTSLTWQEETQIRHDWDQTLFKGGYSMLSLPKEYGGQGLGLAEEVLFADLAAKAKAPDGLARVGKILTAPALIHHGTEDQKSRFLPRIVAGEDVWCQGFSEPGSGSDLASVQCGAVKVDGGWRVTGQKIWTSFAEHAQRCLMLVRTTPEAGRYKNLSLLLLDMTQPGITVRTLKQISGSMDFAEVFFDDVFVEDRDLLGAEGEGWKVAMTILTAERGGIEATTRYVEMRDDVEKLITCCTKGTAKAELAERYDVEAELVRWQVSKAVSREHDAAAFNRATGGLKVVWSELWQKLGELGLDTRCARHRDHWNYTYLETRGMSIYSGTNEIQRNIVADRLLGLPR